MELTDNKLTGKFGTCKTGLKDRDEVHLTVPQPMIGAEDPSAILTLSFPDRGAYDKDLLGEHVM
jgi:hypothetical protein